MAVAMGLGRFIYTPILPGMMGDLGLGPSEAGWIASANYFGYLAGAILAAYGWAEGIERKVALAGLFGTALLLFLMGVCDTVAAFAAIRFLAGLASAFAMIFASSIVLSHGIALNRPSVQAHHFGGVGYGIAFSSLMFGIVMALGGNWRLAWICAAGFAVLGALAIRRMLPANVLRAGPAKPELPLKWSRPLVLLTLSYGLFGFGYIITATFLVAIVRESGGAGHFEAAVWLVTGLAGAPSVMLWASVVRRIGALNVYIIGCLVEAVGVAASVLMPSPLGPLIGALLFGSTFIMITAYGLQAGRAFAGESPRRIFATMTAAFGIGQIIGPVVAGSLANMTGDYLLASLVAAFALIVCAALVAPIRSN